MIEWWKYGLATLAGGSLGGVFRASLWWTVRQLPVSRHPALLFAASFLVRMSVVLGGFLALAKTGDWKVLVAAGVGFALIRAVGVRVVAQDSTALVVDEATSPPDQDSSLRPLHQERITRSLRLGSEP